MTPTSRIKALEHDAALLENKIAELKQEGYEETAQRLIRDLEHINALIAYDKEKEQRNGHS